MVRFPNRRDHSMTPGPPVPEKGAAGKDEKRNEKIRAKQGQTYTNRHQRKIDNPFTETVDGVLGISKDRVEEYKPVYEFDAAGLTSSGDVRNPSKRVSEHLLTGGARWDTRKQPGAPEGGADGDENRSQVAGSSPSRRPTRRRRLQTSPAPTPPGSGRWSSRRTTACRSR